MSAGTGVHGTDEHESGGIGGLGVDAGDGDKAVLHRLSERLKDIPPVFWKLIQKKHAIVGFADLAGNGVDAAALAEPVRRTCEAAKAILHRQRAAQQPPIRLTSTLAFNMTNGSVALGFAPDAEADCAALMTLHRDYQSVVALDYPLTPHVTLAYFRPGSYAPEEVAQLAEALREINALPKVRIAVEANCLHYYTFEDMNTYIRG